MQVNTDEHVKSFSLDKPLQGITLGKDADLWVLCQDGEIINISDSNGTIFDRFYIDGRITQPWGIAYDRKGAIWISNNSDNKIYQVSVVDGAEPNNGYLVSDINKDNYVDINDMYIFVSYWLESSIGDYLIEGLNVSNVIPLETDEEKQRFRLQNGEWVPVDLDSALIKQLEQKNRPLVVDEVVASGKVSLASKEREWHVYTFGNVLLILHI